MTAPVLDLAAARAAHPASTLLPPAIRAKRLVTIARTWDALLDILDEDTLTSLALALVHPAARDAAGPFLLPELIRLVGQYDAIARGDISHKDLEDCGSYEEALDDAQVDIDYDLWQLLSGRHSREACRSCRSTRVVHQWQPAATCSDHNTVRAL